MSEAKIAHASEDEKDQIFELVELLQMTLSMRFPDPVEAMTYGATAALILAGSQYGYAVASGIESGDRNRRRQWLKMCERNLLNGYDVALRKASRVAREQDMQQ